MITVAIISPKRSLQPINQVIETYDFGCTFQTYIYNELTDIHSIYQSCKDNCDVIFFSGELGYHYIHKNLPDIQIPCAFTAYGTKDILSIMLRFVIDHPEIPLNRVYIDFLTPLNNYMDIPKYLSKDNLPYFFEESSFYDYEHLTARTKELWDAGKIDFLITRSINNIKVFDTIGIPYLAVFPSEEMIEESIRTAVNEFRLARTDSGDSLTVIIRLPFENESKSEEREYRAVSLHKVLVDWRHQQQSNFVITSWFDRFELQMDASSPAEAVQQIRPLVHYLQHHLDFPFRLGAGVHHAQDQSHYYAETALMEAVKHGGNDGFLVSGQNAMLTGPLSAATPLLYDYSNERAITFAKENKISESNLMKLIALFEQDPDAALTASSISSLLNITPRSANRILGHLLNAQLITRLEQPFPNKKGRPLLEYRFQVQRVKELLYSL